MVNIFLGGLYVNKHSQKCFLLIGKICCNRTLRELFHHVNFSNNK